MKKKIYFLSGLPRSGSTLLGSLMSQHPRVTVTPTSPLLDMMCYTNESINKLMASYTFDRKTLEDGVYGGIIDRFYDHVTTDVVVDKHRGWPRNITPVRMYIDDNPKIICTYRPVSEVIASYIILIERNRGEPNFVDEHLRRTALAATVENRSRILWESYISDPYQSTVFGMEKCRQNMHFVSYSDLVSKPDEVMSGIYAFLGDLEPHRHSYSGIHNSCREDKDAAWGIKHLHDIRPDLGRTSPSAREVLGDKLAEYFDRFNLSP